MSLEDKAPPPRSWDDDGKRQLADLISEGTVDPTIKDCDYIKTLVFPYFSYLKLKNF